MAGKGKKIVGGIWSVLLLLVVVLLCVFFFWLGPTVKMVAEKVGSKALGAPLTIEKLSINPRKGTLHLSEFKIANQEAFGRSNVISLASLDVAIDMGSIFSQTVVVHQVALNSPYFTYEQGSATDNITEFILNIQEFVGFDPSAPPPPPDPKKLEKEREKQEKKAQKKKEKGPKIVIVESLAINDVQLHLANTDDPRLDIDVSFEQLAISMTNGMVNLKNLWVSNPEHLDTPNLFTLDAINIELDPESIYADTVSILDVQVVRPYAYIEKNLQTDTVAEFMKIAEQFSTTTTNAPTEPAPAVQEESIQEESANGPPPVELHNLLVDDIQIKLLDTSSTNAPAEPGMLAGIGAISVQLVEGHIQIKGITVPNLEGYAISNLFHLANIDIRLDPASLYSKQIVIQEVLIDSPEVNLEQTETSGNVADFQTLLMGFIPPTGAEEDASVQEAAPQAGEKPEPIPLSEQPVVLQSLQVTNLSITLSLPVTTNEAPKSAMELPQIGSLNPLDKMATLNPLTEADAESDDAPDGPLKLVYFDNLMLQPLDGVLQIDGLGVANPPGYANANLVKLNQFRVEIDPDTLQSDVLLIKDILIDTPRIAYERRITTDNLKAMQEEIEKATGKAEEADDAEPTPTDEEASAEANEGQKVIIDHLLVKDGLAKAKLSIAPSLPIPLPDIEMRDIGKEKSGTSFIGAVTEIGTTIYDTLIGAVAGATGFAGDALKGFGALTLPSSEDETEGGDAHLEPVQSSETGDTVDQPTETAPKKRSRRLPGRSF